VEVKTRTANPTRKEIFELKRTHPVVTLNVGDLSANIRRGTSNHSIEHVVLERIQKLVKIMSHAKQLVQLATNRTDGQVLQRIAFDTKKFKKNSSAVDDVGYDYYHSKDADRQGVDRLLESVDDMFPYINAVRNHFSDPEKVTVIGIDLGDTFAAAACAINFAVGDKNGVRNLTVTRSAIYQPTLKARKEIEERKPAKVRGIEQSMPVNKDCSFSA
jgi:hypothetical protein